MNIHEIESVCAVDIYQNYSNAAAQVSLTPAVVSKHVAKVEQELGIRIFERASKSRPVTLTEEGKQIIGNLHAIVRMYRHTQNTIDKLKKDRIETLTVGYTSRVGDCGTNELLTRFALENPNVVLRRKVSTHASYANMLLSGDVDAVFLPILVDADKTLRMDTRFSNPNIAMVRVWENDTLTIGVPNGHPLADAECITRDMYPLLWESTFLLSNEQMEMKREYSDGYLYNFFAFPDRMNVRYIDTSDPAISLSLVENGAGLLVQSGITVRRMGSVNFIPVEGWERRAILHYMYLKNANSKALRKLTACVHRFAEEHKQD